MFVWDYMYEVSAGEIPLECPEGGGGGNYRIKGEEMLVVSHRGVNFGFWTHLGCSEQNSTKRRELSVQTSISL